MKCEICGEKIDETFLKKIIGSYVKDEKGKKHVICSKCQADLNTKERILEKIK